MSADITLKTVTTNSDVVRGAYDAFGRGDVAAVLDLLHDDVEWSSPATLPQGGTFSGKAGVGEFFQGVGASWEALSLDVESVSDAGEDLVVGVVRGHGQLRGGDDSGYGATHVFTVRDGKVSRFREYTDLDGPLFVQ
jgi:ketosteroid isomerase-like protein